MTERNVLFLLTLNFAQIVYTATEYQPSTGSQYYNNLLVEKITEADLDLRKQIIKVLRKNKYPLDNPLEKILEEYSFSINLPHTKINYDNNPEEQKRIKCINITNGLYKELISLLRKYNERCYDNQFIVYNHPDTYKSQGETYSPQAIENIYQTSLRLQELIQENGTSSNHCFTLTNETKKYIEQLFNNAKEAKDNYEVFTHLQNASYQELLTDMPPQVKNKPDLCSILNLYALSLFRLAAFDYTTNEFLAKPLIDIDKEFNENALKSLSQCSNVRALLALHNPLYSQLQLKRNELQALLNAKEKEKVEQERWLEGEREKYNHLHKP